MAAIRRDVNQGGATWNETLIWYAKAVQHLHALPIKDRTSWKYLAAIHGINQKGWIAAHVLSPKDPLPPTSETEQMWDQCQHGTWYFLPWHRGYLAAFEAIVAKTVKDLGGPGLGTALLELSECRRQVRAQHSPGLPGGGPADSSPISWPGPGAMAKSAWGRPAAFPTSR